MNITPLQVRVVRKAIEAEDIASFEFALPDGAPLPAFGAGAHIDVHLPNGLVRQYSLCNNAEETHRYRIAVLRDLASRGGSIGMHDSVHEGDLITISTPRNHFELHKAQRTVLLAGGIGVTPLLCMAQRLAHTGADFELHYCTRSPERTAFVQEIANSPLASKVHYHHDTGSAEQKLDINAVLGAPSADKRVYTCGPAGFIDHVVGSAKALGWASEQIHLEYFAAPAQDTSNDGSFDVRIASTGKVIKIAADKTVTEALRDEGIEILTSCEQGVCGTCLTRVLEGGIEHRDMYLTDEEKAGGDQFMPCCSRASGNLLVLDL